MYVRGLKSGSDRKLACKTLVAGLMKMKGMKRVKRMKRTLRMKGEEDEDYGKA